MSFWETLFGAPKPPQTVGEMIMPPGWVGGTSTPLPPDLGYTPLERGMARVGEYAVTDSIPAEAAKAAWRGVTLPGRVATGEAEMWAYDPQTGGIVQNPAVIEDAAELAGMVTLGAGAMPDRSSLRAGARFVDTDAAGGGGGSVGVNPRLREVYDARAQQMELKPDKRIQPDPNRTPYIDSDYQTPAPSTGFEDLSTKYPRNPDPAAALPLGDRARVLVDRRREIAERLAERIRSTGQMDANTRYFYHSDGPLYRGAVKSGLSPEEAGTWLNDFGNYFAATSPRTEVEFNLRNATSAMAKEAQGIPHRTIVGPGSGGISEAGYPMMTGTQPGKPRGIHGVLLDEVVSGRGINTNTNTKPYYFGNNMVGNRSGVTVDTHAIRGVLQTLNEIEPGSVPIGFIDPKFREAYQADPTKLSPDMILDTIGKQMVGPKGAATEMQSEYPVFADIFHDAADILGVSPAEAQSMAWFGFGDDTNLASAPKTVSEVFDDRLSVTAQALGLPVEEVARRVFRREIPLMGILGTVGAATMTPELLREEDRNRS